MGRLFKIPTLIFFFKWLLGGDMTSWRWLCKSTEGNCSKDQGNSEQTGSLEPLPIIRSQEITLFVLDSCSSWGDNRKVFFYGFECQDMTKLVILLATMTDTYKVHKPLFLISFRNYSLIIFKVLQTFGMISWKTSNESAFNP